MEPKIYNRSGHCIREGPVVSLSSVTGFTMRVSRKLHDVEFNNVGFLNGLRGLAAFSVSIAHGGYLSEFDMGGFGVDTFFVLSAFLLTTIFYKLMLKYIYEKRAFKDWSLMMATFFVRRLMRIYPLFVIIATFLMCFTGIKSEYFCYIIRILEETRRTMWLYNPKNYALKYNRKPYSISLMFCLAMTSLKS